ncbi:hypothetical protein HZS_7125, partial [Henneguya salminicola]
MAEPELYNLIKNSSLFYLFLLEHDLNFDPETISQLNLTCRNANCRDPNKGFKSSTRKRNLTQRNAKRFLEEGQDVLRIDCLKCKSCKTTLSPRTGRFLTYLDSARRSNCKISTAKILQIVFPLIAQRPIVDSIETLGLAKPTARSTRGNEAISTDDQRGFSNMQEDGEKVNINRNFGRQIAGPWVFGMVECHKQPEGSYKLKEVRLYHVERRDENTLLPTIRDNAPPGSVVWSDQWPAYRRIWEEDGLIHEAVNHSTTFLLINMRGTSPALLESHLAKFMWKSRHREDFWNRFCIFLHEASYQHPIG